MHDHAGIFIGALLMFAYGLVSHRAERFMMTAPMFFMAFGVLLSPVGLNLVHIEINAPSAQLLAEITLIVILFTDGTLIQTGRVREVLSGIPARLLGIGLPLTIISGAAVAYILFPGINIWLIFLIALVLSPTDAALGQAVIKSENVPQRIRQSISVESGLNDGIVLPLILACMTIVSEGVDSIDGSGDWVRFLFLQLTFGSIVGAAVGYVGGKLIDGAAVRGLSEPTFQRLASIALALLSYAFAELLHGNGFIAAFFAGLFLGVKIPSVRERMQEFGEAQGQLLSLFVFLILGLVMIPVAVQFWSLKLWLYAGLSLTLIRMLPVWLSLLGSGADHFTKLFIGWFGPRGIASILYLFIIVAELGLSGYEQAMSVIVLTVMLSTLLHGITAVPLSNLYRR